VGDVTLMQPITAGEKTFVLTKGLNPQFPNSGGPLGEIETATVTKTDQKREEKIREQKRGLS